METKNLFAKTRTAITLVDSMKLFFATNKETFKITKKTGAKNLYDKMMVHIMKTIPTLSNVYTLSKQLEAYGIKKLYRPFFYASGETRRLPRS